MRTYSEVFIYVMLLIGSGCSGATAHRTSRVIVPFTISKTGHIVIEAKINNKDVYLVVDTAAGASVIHKKQVKYLDLKAGKSTGDVRGLGTSSYTMQKIDIPVMSIETIKFLKPYFVVMDLSHVEVASDGPFHGLIGSPFLQKYSAIIDYEKEIISLRLPKTLEDNKANKTNAPDNK